MMNINLLEVVTPPSSYHVFSVSVLGSEIFAPTGVDSKDG